MGRGLTAVRLAMGGVLIGSVLAAVPGTAAADEGQRFVIIATDLSGTGRLTATGPIHGVGTDTLLEHTANPDGSFTDRDRFDLPGGEVTLSDTYRLTLGSNPETCVTRISIEGTWTITGSTGAYAGASGRGTFSAAGALVTGRDVNGDCLGLDAPPVTFEEVVRGTGMVSLP